MGDELARALPAGDVRWFVLHTLSRQEKALAESLEKRRVEVFLPLVKEKRSHGRRRVVVERPLFPGYVFLRGTVEEAYEADRTKRVANLIEVADQAALGWELSNIRLALEREAGPLDPHPYLKVGVRVAVRSGPLRGLEGVVAERTRHDRVVLQVRTLGRAVAVETDGALVEVLE